MHFFWLQNALCAANFNTVSIKVMLHIAAFMKLLQTLGLSPRLIILVCSDLAALLGTMGLILLIRAAFGGLDPALYHWVFPLLVISPFLGAAMGIYQLIGVPAHQTMKSIFLYVSLLYGIILAALFLSQTGDMYSRMVIMGSWLATLFALPILRGVCVHIFSRKTWWLNPTIIFDFGHSGHHYWLYLKKHPELCLLPVKIYSLTDTTADWDFIIREDQKKWPRAIALILPGDKPKNNLVSMVNHNFRMILFVPDFEGNLKRHWFSPRQIGGVTAFLLKQSLLDRNKLRMKRWIDVCIGIFFLPILLPLGVLLALAIVLDSKGWPLYRQERVGINGKTILVYKFRTMIANAEEVLEKCLDKNPDLKKEWEQDHKLKNDPRLTRIGRFLRKTSLDELPQVLNVLGGSMSLVGPRPIVAKEIEKYGEVFEEYCRVTPGLTGLWQISGRNNTTYAERVDFDHYYINNWSVWLDIWILFKTVPVAISGYGAY